MILPADKAKATVIMDTEKYEAKIKDMLADKSVYELLKKDPTPCLERRMNSMLLMLKKTGKLPEKIYDRLRCSNGVTPRLYGLPKIHKPDIPLRPIVSFLSSPTYNLSKHLASILSPPCRQNPFVC